MRYDNDAVRQNIKRPHSPGGFKLEENHEHFTT